MNDSERAAMAARAVTIGYTLSDMPDAERTSLYANMSALPVQHRARLTVDRILVAARSIVLSGGPESVTLNAVAERANVRLGAIYRYFSTPDDLIRTFVRIWLARRFDRFRVRLESTQFTSVDDVADTLAGLIITFIAGGFHEPGVSERLKRTIYRDYHDVPFPEIWVLAGAIRAAMARCGLGTGAADVQARLAMGLAAISAYTKMAVLMVPASIGTPDFAKRLRTMLRDALVD